MDLAEGSETYSLVALEVPSVDASQPVLINSVVDEFKILNRETFCLITSSLKSIITKLHCYAMALDPGLMSL